MLTQILKLLHPFMPFITEEIWQALPHVEVSGGHFDGEQAKQPHKSGDYLMLQKWPEHSVTLDFPDEERAMEMIMDAIGAIRTRRSEMNVPPSKKAHVTVATLHRDVFELGIPFLKRLGYASDVTITGVTDADQDTKGMVTVITHAARISIPLAELVDMEKEKARMEKELKKNRAELDKLEAKLQNPGFVNKAPANVVEAERERAVKLRELVAKLEEEHANM